MNRPSLKRFDKKKTVPGRSVKRSVISSKSTKRVGRPARAKRTMRAVRSY